VIQKKQQLSKSLKKYEVNFGPKFVSPGQVFVTAKSETSKGSITVNIVDLEQVVDPSSSQVPIGGGTPNDGGF